MKSFIVDSFTNEPFKGNPAAVCFPAKPLTDEVMLKVAQEFGLSETAFVHSTEDESTFTIRYFSPVKEIPLCGHATLAAGKVIFQMSKLHEIHFITVEKIDLLVKKQHHEISMAFPIYDTVKISIPASMLSALGITEIENSEYCEKPNILLIELSDSDILKGLNPDFIQLKNSYNGINGVLITSKSNTDEYDYHYRYFWPWAGTNEDPVTGGVQTFLAKYWSIRLGKEKMKAFQSSARTGYMNVELIDNKVIISSQAVIMLEGNLLQ